MFKIKSVCKGGGYMYARTEPLHPKANTKGLYPLHRVLAENNLGRLLLPGEIVHHVDHNKSNNDPSNLKVVLNPEHSRHHQEQEVCTQLCAVCKVPFQIKEHVLRLRVGRNKTQKVTCSRSCGASLGHLRVTQTNEDLCGAGRDARSGS